MLEHFLFIALPYVAIVVCVAGSIYRFKKDPYSYSSLSSQFLESGKLRWGSVPWHLGVAVVFVGHLAALVAPQAWLAFLSRPGFLYAVEAVGLAAAFLCAIGLLVLILRRVTTARLQPVTTLMDLVVLFLLLLQVILGILTAMLHRWGAVWAAGTATPYVVSLFTFSPDASYISGMPLVVKAHIALAWVLVLLVPFSRMVHMFSLPLAYLFRPPQKVVWNAHPTGGILRQEEDQEMTRRHFLKGAVGVTAGAVLLSVGVLEKFFQFFRGPRPSAEREAEQIAITRERLQKSADEKALELERLTSETILVAPLSELSETKGKYFIDYQMRPALAFKGPDGFPLLISAKCTHLGCTVGSERNSQGRVLCPCHVSYFDVTNGRPDPGSPAKAPLPILGWVLTDPEGRVVASRAPGGAVEGSLLGVRESQLSVRIAKRHEGGHA
jgi:nitrate reductase gamma subunit